MHGGESEAPPWFPGVLRGSVPCLRMLTAGGQGGPTGAAPTILYEGLGEGVQWSSFWISVPRGTSGRCLKRYYNNAFFMMSTYHCPTLLYKQHMSVRACMRPSRQKLPREDTKCIYGSGHLKLLSTRTLHELLQHTQRDPCQVGSYNMFHSLLLHSVSSNQTLGDRNFGRRWIYIYFFGSFESFPRAGATRTPRAAVTDVPWRRRRAARPSPAGVRAHLCACTYTHTSL